MDQFAREINNAFEQERSGMSVNRDIIPTHSAGGVVIHVPLQIGRPSDDRFWERLAQESTSRQFPDGSYIIAVHGEEMVTRQVVMSDGQVRFVPVDIGPQNLGE